MVGVRDGCEWMNVGGVGGGVDGLEWGVVVLDRGTREGVGVKPPTHLSVGQLQREQAPAALRGARADAQHALAAVEEVPGDGDGDGDRDRDGDEEGDGDGDGNKDGDWDKDGDGEC